MTKETRAALLYWSTLQANNILVGATGNHMGSVSAEARQKLAEATRALGEALDQLRKES
jgi:hypothetical protein